MTYYQDGGQQMPQQQDNAEQEGTAETLIQEFQQLAPEEQQKFLQMLQQMLQQAQGGAGQGAPQQQSGGYLPSNLRGRL